MTWFFFQFLDWSRRTAWLMALVVLTCLAVGGWGFYAYYGPQFRAVGAENWYVWPFIPDCPLFVYLFVAAFAFVWFRRPAPTFIAFVALGNIKYGIWTVFVLLRYYERFFGGEDAAFRSIILGLHIAMVPLGLLLWRSLPSLRAHQVGVVLGAMLVYDYFDYFFTNEYQVYPVGLPNGGGFREPYAWQQLDVVPWFTLFQSLALAAILYWLNVARAAQRQAAPTPAT